MPEPKSQFTKEELRNAVQFIRVLQSIHNRLIAEGLPVREVREEFYKLLAERTM